MSVVWRSGIVSVVWTLELDCSVEVRTSEHYADIRASDLCGNYSW